MKPLRWIVALAFLAASSCDLVDTRAPTPTCPACASRKWRRCRACAATQLVGYGLVVGLDGTGDQTTQTPFTTQSLNAMLQQLGVTVPAGVTAMQLQATWPRCW